MKKLLALLLAFSFIFTACSSDEASEESGVDLDLSTMNSTMAYAHVNDMIENAESYASKTIKLKGEYVTDETGTRHYIMVVDETLCCYLPLEIVVSVEEFEYPEIGTEVLAIGRYEAILHEAKVIYRVNVETIEIL